MAHQKKNILRINLTLFTWIVTLIGDTKYWPEFPPSIQYFFPDLLYVYGTKLKENIDTHTHIMIEAITKCLIQTILD